MIYKILKSIFTLFFAVLVLGCKKNEPVTTHGGSISKPEAYVFSYPDFFPKMIIPEENPTTLQGVQLGKKLYYDPILSLNGPLSGMSCSSCHEQEYSFSLPSNGTSVLPHTNLAWSNYFLWNGKISGSLEDAMIFELNDFFKTDIHLIAQHEDYANLYFKAFENKDVSINNTAFALAQFFRTMVSSQSQYDQFIEGNYTLTPSQQRGMEIFFTEKGDCFHCHSDPLFTNNGFHNIGLDSVFTTENSGRSIVTGYSLDIGKFKTPTLRNIELTAPYMHDGRFSTLEEVINHYNTGIKHSVYLDPIMTKAGKEFGLGLTTTEKADLIAFLKTLTDHSFIENTEFSKPN